MKKVRKSEKNKVLSGVCGGLGEYFDIDPVVIRVGFVFASFFDFGVSFVSYLVLAIFIPSRSDKSSTQKYKQETNQMGKNDIRTYNSFQDFKRDLKRKSWKNKYKS